MADIKIEVRGLNELQTYLTNLPSKLNKNFSQGQKEFASFVQKSAKLRAPRTTGSMAQSIQVTTKGKETTISVDSPYAYFQEFGFKPHMIYPDMDNREGVKLSDLGFTHPVMVKSYHPFIVPAVEMGIAKLNMILNRSADKALKD